VREREGGSEVAQRVKRMMAVFRWVCSGEFTVALCNVQQRAGAEHSRQGIFKNSLFFFLFFLVGDGGVILLFFSIFLFRGKKI